MYATPAKADLDRNLSGVSHDARHLAQAEVTRLTREFSAKGLALSGGLIGSAVSFIDKIHREALDRAATMLRDFAERMKVPPSEIVEIARPHLANMGNSILGELPAAGAPQAQQKVRQQYLAVFEQRLSGMLRDFEIGFVGGRNVATVVSEDAQADRPKSNQPHKLRDPEIRGRLLSHLYDFRHRNGGFVPVSNIIFAGHSPIDDDIIGGVCRQLSDAGLIEWNAYLSGPVIGNARIKGLGIDAIERGEFTGLKIYFPARLDEGLILPSTQMELSVSEEAIADTREVVDKLKVELPVFSLSNSEKANVSADITQIETEIGRPVPRGHFLKLFVVSLRDNLAKAAGTATAAGLTGLITLVSGLLAKYFGMF